MGEQTKIEWCDHSWSPWRGCTKISPGCANCYAETLSKRNPAVLGNWGKGKPRVLAKNWGDPVRWNNYRFRCPGCGHWNHQSSDWCQAERSGCSVKADLFILSRPTVFPSLCDWLDEEVPVEWLARFLQLIHDTPNLTWLLLTKRPENWDLRITEALGFCLMQHASKSGPLRDWIASWKGGTPPANVWVGTSVEDQERADERIPALLSIPAAGRFLSAEPLLGPVDLEMALEEFQPLNPDLSRKPAPVGWVIVGGESGPGSRPCHVDWIRSLVSQCKDAAVPVFVKQLGARPIQSWGAESRIQPGDFSVRLAHRKGGDPAEWTKDLRVREFPWGAFR